MVEPQLANLAIKYALSQNWKEAILTNLKLINQNAEDVAALNRLAFAYIKSGNLTSAKSTYKKVLKLDKFNPIALKNLKWLSNLVDQDIKQDPTISPTPSVFLEEPGKTKIVTLVHLAPAQVICNLTSSQKVFLNPRKHAIEIRDSNKSYIGALPDDLSHRLLKFIRSGNTYDVYIKNVAKNSITIFIREINRGKKFINIPSFSVFTNLPIRSNPIPKQLDAEEEKNISSESPEDAES